jgi:hypothetical protein
MQTSNNETQLFYFCQYTCFYYSASSNPWEAAYINCFDIEGQQVGIIIFTYEGATIPAGQENRIEGGLVKLYYPLSRYNDVVNLLRYAVNTHYCDCKPGSHAEPHNVKLEPQSVYFSINMGMNIWALCNNLHMAVGAQYHV